MSELCLYYQNVNGLRTKLHEFSENLLNSNFDAIALSETRLYSYITDQEFFDDRYSIYRNDLADDGGRGWGVLLAVKDCYSSELIDSANGEGFEFLCVKVNFGNCNVFLIVVYIPPASNMYIFEKFYDCIESLNGLIDGNIVLVGDFNLPEINAADYNLLSGSLRARRLSNFSILFNLELKNNILNANGRTLDLVLSNMDVSVLRDASPLVVEDAHHPALEIAFVVSYFNLDRNLNSFANNLIYNYKRADYLNLYISLSNIDWSSLYCMTDVDEAVNLFYIILFSVIDFCVPKRKAVKKQGYPFWFTSEIIKEIKLKNRLARKRRHSDVINSRFVLIRRSLKTKIREANRRYLLSVQSSVKGNIRKFWSYVNNKRTAAARMRKAMILNATVLESNVDIANGFANYFASVYEDSVGSCDVSLPVVSQQSILDLRAISIENVKMAINSLKPRASCGPDGIPPFLVRGCSDILSINLCFIFNLSLKLGVFPNEWKLSRVSPIFKSGNMQEITNFRPISLTNVFSKIFENVIFDYIYKHMMNDFNKQQHGFLPAKSTVTNLIEFSSDVLHGMDSSGRVDVIYIDFRRAFDLVNHDVLLRKLLAYNISDSTVKFLSSYLKGRKQFVSYDGCDSDPYVNISGVPQGTSLGPLLFLIMINDLPDVLNNSKCLLFADDVKVYRTITKVHDCNLLQEDINRILLWSSENGLRINSDKSNIMIYSRQLLSFNFSYFLNGSALPTKVSCKDLGVYFQNDFRFTSHIEHILNVSNRLLGFVIRTCKNFSNLDTIIYLYKSLVRSRLEYASIIWDPYHAEYSDSLEKVQNKFLRYLYFKKFGYYPYFGYPSSQLRNMFKIPTLKSRRDFQAIIHLYKVINGLVQHPFHLERLGFYVPTVTRGRYFSFFIPRSRTLQSFNSPINRSMRLYNAVSRDIDIFNPSLNAFMKSCTILLKY
jgi:hypothetical protein